MTRTKRAVLLLAALCLCGALPGPALWAQTYYVDSSLGKDTNAGTSLRAPWQTLARVNAAALAPGDAVMFRRGRMWREQLTISSSGGPGQEITFGAYGRGRAPVISALDLLPPEEWVGPDADGVYTWATRLWRYVLVADGKVAPEAVGDSPLAPGQWRYGAGAVHYRPSRGTASQHVVEVGSRGHAVLGDGASYVTLNGLELRGSNGNSGTEAIVKFNCGSNVTIQRCCIKQGHLRGVYFCPSMSEAAVLDSEVTEVCGHGVMLQGSRCRLRNVHVHHIGQGNSAPDVDRTGVGLRGVDNVVEECLIHDCYHPTVGDPTAGYGIVAYLARDATIRRNKVYRCDHEGISIQPGGGDIYAYDNIIYECGRLRQTGDVGWYGGIRVGATEEPATVHLYNNTIQRCDGQTTSNPHQNAGIGLWAGPGRSAAVRLFNNIVSECQAGYDLTVAAAPGGSLELISDYNCFYRKTPGRNFKYLGRNYTFGEYAAASGQEEHSLAADPRFVHPGPGRNYLGLRRGSPCIDAGYDVGLTSDFYDLPLIGPPDMGAIEYRGR